MTLKKLLALLSMIEAHYGKVGISMHGSILWASGGCELTLTFNTHPPKDLDSLLRRKGFITLGDDYIYRPRVKS
jgi:hypothetical protein